MCINKLANQIKPTQTCVESTGYKAMPSLLFNP